MPSVAAPGQRGWEWQGPDLLPAATSIERCHAPPTQKSCVIQSEPTDAFRPMLTFTKKVGGIAWRRENGFLQEQALKIEFRFTLFRN